MLTHLYELVRRRAEMYPSAPALDGQQGLGWRTLTVAGTERLIPPRKEEFKGRVIAGIPVSITRGPLAIAFGAPLTLLPGESPPAFAARLQEASYTLTGLAEQALDQAAAVPAARH